MKYPHSNSLVHGCLRSRPVDLLRAKHLLLAAAALFAIAPTSKAVTYTWDNNGGNSRWGEALNWHLDSGFPNAVGDSAVFGNSAAPILADASGNDASFTLGSLLSNTGATNFSIANVASGTGRLIFENTSGTASITTTKNGGQTNNFNVGITLNSNLLVNSRGGTGVTFQKSIISGTGLTTGLTVAGTPLGNSSGGAYVTIGAASTYTGSTTLGGSLSITTANGGGKLRIGGTDFMPTSTILTLNASNVNVSFAQGGRFSLNGFNQTIGGLAGASGTATGVVTNDTAGATTGTLTINNASDYSFAGTIANAVTVGNLGVTALTKSGSGTQTLTGNSTYTGATLISAGTLVVGVSGTGSLGNTAVTVGSNGVLAGSGTIGGAVTLSGTLTPGNSPGTLTINNSLSMTSSASTLIELSGTSLDQFDRVIGLANLTLDGTITVSLLSFAPVAGDSFDLFDWSGTLDSSAFNVATDLVLPTLSGGLGWDTSGFLSSGVIVVSAVPEPSVALLLGVGLCGFLKRQRKGQRAFGVV